MSNRSRARYRAEAEQAQTLSADEQAQQDAVLDAYKTMEKDQRAGLSKWSGLVLRDREKALATPEPEPIRTATKDRPATPYREPLRQPTAYESAVLFALGNRVTVVDGGARGPIAVPVSIASGGVYGGTVEPERVEHSRRRNKAARAARSGNRRRVVGHVHRSRFGNPVRVPGISPGIDIDGYVDAEVVDA